VRLRRTLERSAGLRPAAAWSAERAQEIPWVFERLNVLRLTEPRSAVTEIDLGNTPLTLRQAKLHAYRVLRASRHRQEQGRKTGYFESHPEFGIRLSGWRQAGPWLKGSNRGQ
jgi:hypothetical protein